MDIHEINLLPITDREQIAMLVEAGEDTAAELIQELLDLFVEEAQPQMVAIEAAVTAGAVDAAARPAHALAGSSANLGGLRLSKLGKALEFSANAGDVERFILLAREVHLVYEATVQAFKEEIAGLQVA